MYAGVFRSAWYGLVLLLVRARVRTKCSTCSDGSRREQGRKGRREEADQWRKREEDGTGKWRRGEEYYRFAGARELTVCLHEHAGTDGHRSVCDTAGRNRQRAHAPPDQNNNNRVEGSWLADRGRSLFARRTRWGPLLLLPPPSQTPLRAKCHTTTSRLVAHCKQKRTRAEHARTHARSIKGHLTRAR